MFYRSLRNVCNTKQLRMSRLSINADYSYLKWDGSYLGRFPISCKIVVVKEFPYSKCVLELVEGYQIIVRFHTCKNSYACIVDELNTIFGKVKIGTHTLRLGSTLYTIYNLPQEKLVKLKDCQPVSDDFKISAQDVFVYRVVVGLTIHSESSIYIHPFGGVTSYRNNKEVITGVSQSIPIMTMDKWFFDDYESSISRMVCNAGGLHKVRTKVQNVIRRIDKNMIWLDHLIYDNITKLI